MRVSGVTTATMFAGDALLTTAECAIEPHARPGTALVGIDPDIAKAVIAHVRHAIKSSGFEWPGGQVTLNLSPAATRRRSCSSGLPLALAVLVASGQLAEDSVTGRLFFGELRLSGDVIAPSKVVTTAVTRLARSKGLMPVLHDESHADDKAIRDVTNLLQATRASLGEDASARPLNDDTKPSPDFSDLQGYIIAKRAAELAVLTHTPLMLRTRRPELADAIAERIHTIMKPGARLMAPSHAADLEELSGYEHDGPGVLYLAQLDGFSREQTSPIADAIQGEPEFLLVASTRPCPCGHLGDPKKPCTCAASQVRQWQDQVEGPLRDMFGIVVDLVEPDETAIDIDTPPISSAQMSEHVRAARKMAATRITRRGPNWTAHATEMFDELAETLEMGTDEQDLVRRLARADADLYQSESVTTDHVTEAVALHRRLPWA